MHEDPRVRLTFQDLHDEANSVLNEFNPVCTPSPLGQEFEYEAHRGRIVCIGGLIAGRIQALQQEAHEPNPRMARSLASIDGSSPSHASIAVRREIREHIDFLRNEVSEFHHQWRVRRLEQIRAMKQALPTTFVDGCLVATGFSLHAMKAIRQAFSPRPKATSSPSPSPLGIS